MTNPTEKEKVPPTPSNEVVGDWREEVGGHIHAVLNEAVTRKLTVEEYKRVTERIAYFIRRTREEEYLRGRGERESELLVEISTMMVERAKNADYKGLNALTDVLALLNRSTPSTL